MDAMAMPSGNGAATALTTLAIVSITISFILVLLRYYVRWGVSRTLALDDYVLAVSQLCYIVYIAVVLRAIKCGIGSHLWDADDLVGSLKYFWLSQILYVATVTFVKITVVIFFCSLRPPRILRNISIFIACLSVVTGIVYGSFIIFICSPPSYFWHQFYPGAGKCMDVDKAYVALQIINIPNILADVTLAILPCIMVRNMNMKRGKKIGVSILLGLSTLPAIVSILREFHTHQVLYNVADFTYSAWVLTLTEIAEPGVGITVTCVAQLRPLFKKLVPQGWLSTGKKPSTGGSPIVIFGQQGSNPRRTPKNDTEVSLDELIEDAQEVPVGGAGGLIKKTEIALV